MRTKLKHASSDSSHFFDIGVGVVSGGLGGIAVSVLVTWNFLKFSDSVKLFTVTYFSLAILLEKIFALVFCQFL